VEIFTVLIQVQKFFTQLDVSLDVVVIIIGPESRNAPARAAAKRTIVVTALSHYECCIFRVAHRA